MERYGKKNKGNPQRTPRSRSNRFPHLEEILIGGKIDLDLLSLSPQKDARDMGGMERESKLLKVNNGGEREGVAISPRRKKGTFHSPLHEI
jgi:hypothetical protein